MTRTSDGKLTTGYPTVTKIRIGSPAETAGIRVGDVILEANGKDLIRYPAEMYPVIGKPMALRVRRGNTEVELVVTPIAPITH